MSRRKFEIVFALSGVLNKNFAKSVNQAESKLANLSSGMTKWGNNITRSVGLPLKGIGAASVITAQNWESAWVGVRKVTKASEEDLQALEATARRMAKELPHTHAAIASVMEAGSRLGVSTGYLEDFSRTMLAVESVTTVIAIFF